MALEFTCPACGGTLQVGDDAIGRVVRCGGCLTMLRVPETAARDFPEVPASPYGDAPQGDTPRGEALPRATPVSEEPQSASSPPREQPRPRRARPVDDDEPLPSSRGTLFWVLLAMGVVGLGCMGFCGGLMFFASRAEKWHQYQSQNGGFRVELPAPPRQDLEVRPRVLKGGKNNPLEVVEGTKVPERDEEYLVMYRDLPLARLALGEQEILAREVKELEESPEVGEVLRKQKINTPNGLHGQEVIYQSRHGGIYTTRFFLVGSRLYELSAGGPMCDPDDARVAQFLNSFEVTDGKLIQEARAREKKTHPAPKAGEEPAKNVHLDDRQKIIESGAAVGNMMAETIDLEVERLERAQMGEAGYACGEAINQAVREAIAKSGRKID
jgi:hypothetical protein